MKSESTKNITRQLILSLILALFLVAGSAYAGDAWSVDDAHTKVGFSVNHFFTPVNGQFSEFKINLDYNPETRRKSA